MARRLLAYPGVPQNTEADEHYTDQLNKKELSSPSKMMKHTQVDKVLDSIIPEK